MVMEGRDGLNAVPQLNGGRYSKGTHGMGSLQGGSGSVGSRQRHRVAGMWHVSQCGISWCV